MKIKKATSLILAGILSLGLLAAGCGQAESQPEGDAAGLSGSLQLAGSTSVQPLAEELATVFMDENPDVTIDVQGGGSSAGVKAAAEGVANIGMASRELKEEEISQGLVPVVIAKDGIAVIVNNDNPVGDLTIEDVKKIFTGEVTNWQEIGGSDAPIVVINREEGSGTYGAFEELVLGKEAAFTTDASTQNSTGAVRTAVSSDPNAIGYISMGTLDESVKALMVGGVAPTEATVIDGTYTISRPFNFLTKGAPDALSQAFIDWILSPAGQEIVGEEFVPLN